MRAYTDGEFYGKKNIKKKYKKWVTATILIEDKNINHFKRDEILKRFNFASPYVELPKKLTVKQNLEIYGRLYGVQNLNTRINEISGDLGIKNFFNRIKQKKM